MEEPQEVHTDENRALPEKKPKKVFKTPAQVAALENFYNEHKYPTEAMKLELAELIGLTEKQVSGWFCHRRLKDKKPLSDEFGAHGKQERSSDVIQDLGSGFRQDSCGSTKQGDNKHYDPKEVESKRFTTEVRYDHGSQRNTIMDMDDNDGTSSGSSSPLKDYFHPQNVDRFGPLTSKYYNDLKSLTSRSGPTGYLKVKGQVENAAITAVRRQLGRNYREDGPPLGIEFEPLPLGAFENLAEIPDNQFYYVGDRTPLHPRDGSNSFQLPSASKIYERYNSKTYDPMDLGESTGLEIRHAPKHHSNSQYKLAPPFSKHSSHSVSRRSLQQLVVNDDSGGETGNHFETRIKHYRDHIEPKIDVKQAENYPRSYNSGPPKVHYGDRFEPKTSDFTYKRAEFVQFEDKGLSRKTHKDAKFGREGRGIGEYSKLASAMIHPGNGVGVTKRSRDEFMHQAYPRKEALVDFKRSTAQMTSSFSDDEAAETTSGD